MVYFRWTQSEYIDQHKKINNWYLEKMFFVDQDPWDFKSGTSIESRDINATAIFRSETIYSDFPFTAFDVPVYSTKLKMLMEKHEPNSIQYLPLKIINENNNKHVNGYYIANYLNKIDCLDRINSKYEAWTKENLMFLKDRPQMLYTFRDIQKVVLDSKKISNNKIFRLWGWDVMIIVREDIKNIIEAANIIGCNFNKIETT